MRDAETRYPIIEKQAYSLVKSIEYFRAYVGYNKIYAYVLYPVVKDVLSQIDCLGSKGKWVSKIQEYDLDIVPMKVIKGQGLAEMMTESNSEALREGEEEQLCATTLDLEEDEWYKDIVSYLRNLSAPPHLVNHKRRALRLKASKFCLTQGGLGWMSLDMVILICVNREESGKLMKEFHAEFCGGHYTSRITTHKILRAGYYWPTIFSDTLNFVKQCHPCPFFAGKQHLDAMPL